MATVFVLHHEYEWCGRDEVKIIGVYATVADAEDAITRLRVQPGFRDWPEGFRIVKYEVGVDSWVEGFVTMINILVPSQSGSDPHKVAVSKWRPGDLYEITHLDDPENAAFSVGDLVRCEERQLEGLEKPSLVATEIAPARDSEGS